MLARPIDDVLRRLDHLIAEMGGIAEKQLAEAITAVVRRDADLAAQICERDREIDALESDVNQLVMQITTAAERDRRDLRCGIVAIRVASQLERIGDYAANLARRTEALRRTPAIPATYLIPRMGQLVQAMIKNVLDAYIARDAAKAADVRERDIEVDQLHSSLFRELLTYMMEDPRNITPCAHLLFIAKNIERIGDHATNIAENVHFLVHGAEPPENRRKGDASSLTVISSGEAP